MIAQYEPNVKATIAFLRLQGVRVNNFTVNETLQNHPAWPSLLCISDSLQKWNVPNAAGKIEVEDIDQLPVPFIACTRDVANQVAVVTQVTATHVYFYSSGKGKSIRLDRTVFFKTWDGIYLIAEPSKESGEKNYSRVKRKLLLQVFAHFTLLLLLTAFSFLGLLTVFEGKADTTAYVQYLVYLIGIIITSLLLWYEIDRNNPLLKKVCTGLSKGSCEAILTGSQANLLGWLSWSEVGFFYFSGSLLTLLFVPGTIHILAWFSLLAMPYIIFSIYYQWRVAKRWCVLCLAVQALLLISGINTLVGHFVEPFVLSSGMLLKTAGCFILPGLCWYSIKPYCLRLQQAVVTKREHLRIKFNTEIFDMLLKKQKPITVPVANIGIDLGKAGAVHTLIKVCNPYCGPCSTAHPKIEKLLEENNNLCVKIIFTGSGKDDDIQTKPVTHLMAIVEEQNEQLTKKALDDWYLAEKKSYEVFAKQYPMNGELLNQAHKIDAMHNWCQRMNVVATPTVFLNGYQLPDAYSIGDLEYFLLE